MPSNMAVSLLESKRQPRHAYYDLECSRPFFGLSFFPSEPDCVIIPGDSHRQWVSLGTRPQNTLTLITGPKP